MDTMSIIIGANFCNLVQKEDASTQWPEVKMIVRRDRRFSIDRLMVG